MSTLAPYLGSILTVLITAAGVVWRFSRTDSRVEAVERTLAELRALLLQRIAVEDATEKRVARLEWSDEQRAATLNDIREAVHKLRNTTQELLIKVERIIARFDSEDAK